MPSRAINRSIIVSLATVGAIAATAQAQLSELYLNEHDDGAGGIYVVQGGVIVRQWAGRRGSLFVTSTVRAAGNSGGAGAEYTLAGVVTGTTFPAPGTAGMHVDDSTTDGTFAYGLDYNTQRVMRFNLNWSSPTLQFSVPGGNAAGVTWDSTDNTFWTAGWTNNLITHFTYSGTVLGSFPTTNINNVGIAVDQADHTLWITRWGTNQLQQYSTAGALIQTLSVPGLPTDISGAEFAIPAPGAAALAGITALGAARRRRPC